MTKSSYCRNENLYGKVGTVDSARGVVVIDSDLKYVKFRKYKI